jgi:hypothetical protein
MNHNDSTPSCPAYRAMKRGVRVTLVGLLLASPGATAPEDEIPDHFAPESVCMDLSRDCECADLPMMDAFLDNQVAAKNKWAELRSQTQSTGSPSTHAGTRKAFGEFVGDPAITAQFATCDDFDAGKNKASHVAGGSLLLGQALLDPCFCKTFCRDIVASTIAHEHAHLLFNLGAIGIYSSIGVACKSGLVGSPLCGPLDALALEGSELYAYGKGIEALEESIAELALEYPEMDCTSEEMVEEEDPPFEPESPEGFWDRVELLGRQFVEGQ